MPTTQSFDEPLWHRVHTAADLRAEGLTKRGIRAAVIAGELQSVRRGVYVRGDTPEPVVEAARESGRVACVSALALRGVFVLSAPRTHMHFERFVTKRRPASRSEVWHWAPLIRAPHPRAAAVHVVDALVQATTCQEPRAALATLDSALHLRLIDQDDLDEIFERVPLGRRVLRTLVDGRAESGPETLLRIIALSLGFQVELQVVFEGVGRVDLVLDGWLVVECDSSEFHGGWAAQKRDRRRDLALAALGMSTLRPVAEDIMYNPQVVIDALRGLRAAGSRAVGVPGDC